MAAIDIGSGASDRNSVRGSGFTHIDRYNPANATGKITSFDFWFNSSVTGVKVGTFYGSGVSYTSRDVETIGSVAGGSKQTFTGLNCSVTTGDFAGLYFASGGIEIQNVTPSTTIYYRSNDQFGQGTKTYNLHDNVRSMSVRGTGTTPPVAPTVTTQAVDNIGTTTATGNGNITAIGSENCSKRGVCWNTTGNPTVADDKSEETDSFGTGAFERPMTGLTPGEHYYVKAYAYNSGGYGYGGQVEFTAKNPITVTPSTLALNLTTYAPSVNVDFCVTPTTLALVLTSYVPIIEVTDHIIVTPTTLALTLTTHSPTVSTPRLVTPEALALVLTAYAPTVLTPVVVAPSTLALVLTAYAPTVLTPRLVTPSTLALLLTAYVPTVLTPRLVTPDTLELVLTTYSPRLWLSIKALKLHPYAYSKERTVEL